eukprot:UN25448
MNLQFDSLLTRKLSLYPGDRNSCPLTLIFPYFLFYVKNYLDITEMRPGRRWKALILYFTILISFK